MNPLIQTMVTQFAATNWRVAIGKYIKPQDIVNLIIVAKTYRYKQKTKVQKEKSEIEKNSNNKVIDTRSTSQSKVEQLIAQVQNHERLIGELMQVKTEAESVAKDKSDKQTKSDEEFQQMISKFVSDDEAQSDTESINSGLPITLTRVELMGELRKLGFKTCITASNAWQTTYFSERADGTMLILIRTREIDILKTPSKLVEMLNEDGKVKVYTQVESHQYAEYHYRDSKINVHREIFNIATAFAANEYIDEAVFCKVGINKKEWARKYGTPVIRNVGDGDSELYDAICHGDGEPAYLSDGLWIDSSGRTYDRGR